MPRKTLKVRKKLDARDLLPRRHKEHDAAAIYLLHTIITRRAYLTAKKKKTGWLSINATVLRSSLGRAAADVVPGALVDAGVLERDNRYAPGHSSMRYRLGSDLLGIETYGGTISDAALIQRIESWREREFASRSPGEQHLMRMAGTLGIDGVAARRTLTNLNLSPHKHERSIESIEAIERGDSGSIRVCRFGRLHTPATRLKRELREHLTIDGVGGLEEVDIWAAQPLLLGGTCAMELGSRPADLKMFIELCEAGQLYRHLTKATGWTGTIGEWKAEVWFAFIFGANRSNVELSLQGNEYLYRLCHLFAAEFPSLYQWMVRRRQGKNWRSLSTDMQRAESDLMIRGLGERLLQDYPTVPVITIHDGAMVPPQNAELVIDLIREQFARRGLRPRVRVKD